MINQPEISIQSNKTLFDILMVGLGVFFGGIVALSGLWLWLNYRSDPTHSLLASSSAHIVAWLPATWRVPLGHEAQLLGLPLSRETKAYWYMARAGGLVGYLLLWLSVIWGLALSTKISRRLVPAPITYGLHEFLSLGTILFSTLHATILLGDSYINFNILHLIIPFTAPYRPLWTGLGTIAFYLIAALTGSFYIRRQIGPKTWRALHYLTFVAYVLVLTHSLLTGSDSGVGQVKLMYLLTSMSVLFLTCYRLFTIKKLRGLFLPFELT